MAIISGILHAARDAKLAIGQGAALQYWAANLLAVVVSLWFAWRYESKLRGAR